MVRRFSSRRVLDQAFFCLDELENRLLMTAGPTSLVQVTLPGAGGAWDLTNGPWYPSPVVADVDGDGVQEIIVTGGDNELHLYKYENGTAELVRNYVQTQSPDLIQSTPVVVAIPGATAVFVGTHSGLVYGWNANTGAVLPGWPKDTKPSWDVASLAHPILTAIAAADVNGDGIPELLVAGIQHELDCFDYKGNLLWQQNNDDTILSSPAVGDVNGDGSPDIVDGGDSSSSAFYWQGGRINVVSATGQRELVYQTNQVVWSSPALADLSGDGTLDIVSGTGFEFGESQGAFPGNYVYAITGNGTPLAGWPFHTESNDSVDGRVQASPAIGDLNGDGKLDVVVATGGGDVIAINNNGTQLWRTSLGAGQNIWASPIIGDINGDGQQDVVIGLGSTMYGLDGRTGAIIWQHTENQYVWYYGAAAIGHFKGDSSLQLVTLGNAVNQSTIAPESPSLLSVYNLPTTAATPAWGAYRRGGNNTAVERNDGVDSSLITKLYQDDLGRTPGGSEVAYWMPQFSTAGTLGDVVQKLVGSTEARTDNIDSWYLQYLNRTAESSGVTYWLNYLANTSNPLAPRSYASGQAQIIASTEAYTTEGGGTNTGWVNFLYETLLFRTPSQSETNYWVNKLNKNLLTRAGVAQGFFLSEERTDDIVKIDYVDYTPGGQSTVPADSLAAGGGDLRSGARTEEQVLDKILTSNGNYVVTQTQGSWIQGMYEDALGRAPTVTETTNWLQQLAKGMTATAIATTIIDGQEFKTHWVNTEYLNLLGRNASSGELTYWVGLLSNGTKTEDQVIHDLIGSQEYYTHAGGTNDAFITKVYMDLFGFPAAQANLTQWDNAAAQGQNIRDTLPTMILFGAPDEYHQQLIDNLYLWYYRRYTNTDADGSRLIPGGTAFGSPGNETYLNNGGSADAIRIAILADPNYQQLWRTKSVWLGSRWLDNPDFNRFA